MSNPQRFAISYNIVNQAPDGITKAMLPAGYGATDALVMISITRSDDGSTGYALLSLEGATDGALDDTEIFRAWCFMAYALSRGEGELPKGDREMCGAVYDAIKAAVLKQESGGPMSGKPQRAPSARKGTRDEAS